MTTKEIIEEAIKVVRPKVFGDSEIGMVGGKNQLIIK